MSNNIFSKEDARQIYEIQSYSGNTIADGQYQLNDKEEEIISRLKEDTGGKILEPLLQAANGGRSIKDEEQYYEEMEEEDSNIQPQLSEEERETLRQIIVPSWKEISQIYQPLREKVLQHIQDSIESFDDLLGSSLEEVDA